MLSFFPLKYVSGDGKGAAVASQHESRNGDGHEVTGEGHPRETRHGCLASQATRRHQSHQPRNVQKTTGWRLVSYSLFFRSLQSFSSSRLLGMRNFAQGEDRSSRQTGNEEFADGQCH